MSSIKVNKVILFYNTNSGNGMFKHNLDHIIRRFQENGQIVVPIHAGDGYGISEFMEDLDVNTYKNDFSKILVAGGDGTLNVCVNAMIKNGIDLPIAILPAGTANDFASYLGIPSDIDGMLDIALSDEYTEVDVGLVNGRYFINVAAIGQVVGVSQRTDKTLKSSIGVLAYYLKGLSELTNLKPIKVKMTTDKEVYEEDMYFMVVMNGRAAGGFKFVAPDSEINDGLLDVMMFREISSLEMPGLFLKILQGNHPKDKHVLSFKTNNLLLESEDDMPTDVDGEHGVELPMRFSVIPKKIKVFARKT